MGWREVEFSGGDSAERVRRLQGLCARAACDGLLIVGGVDSFHATLAQAVLKFLFLGASGQEVLGPQVITQANDRLEDVVLLIQRQRLSIFYSSESEAAVQILPRIAQWRNVTEFVIHDGMDPDEQECRKIRAFRAMVTGVRRIGIPYGVDARGRDLADPMIPEKWPLIQSYGLENDGNSSGSAPGRGFFTMNHEVINVSTMLQREMARLDGFGARRILQEVEPLLSHHYQQFLTKLDHAESPGQRNARSEAEMGEDLLSFYEFGTTQYESRGLRVPPHRGCRVLFGHRTGGLVTHKSSATALLRNSGPTPALPAMHVLVQVEDPFTGVRFLRTYFMATGKTVRRVIDEDALVHPTTESESKEADADDGEDAIDTQGLVELYVMLLRGFRAAVGAFAQAHAAAPTNSVDACLAKAKERAMVVMNEYSRDVSRVLQAHKFPGDFLQEHFVLSAESLDSCGQETEFPAEDWNLVQLTAEIRHIPSQRAVTESLGSVIVGDTILLKSASAPADVNVTAAFPYFRSWVGDGREDAAIRRLLGVLQSEFMLQSPALQLGPAIVPLDVALDDGAETSNVATNIAPSTAPRSMASLGLSKATLLLESEELPVLYGTLQLFTRGFCFRSPSMSPIIVSFGRHVDCLRVLPTAHEELVLLQIELRQGTTVLEESIPFAIRSRILALPLLTGTRFQEEMIRAMGTWRASAEALGLAIYRPHELSSFDGLTPREETGRVNGGGGGSATTTLSPILARACDRLVRKAESATAIAVDRLFPRWFIPKDTNPTTTLPRAKADRTKMCVPITVLLGLPGSDVLSLSKLICGISSAANDWTHVIVDVREAPAADRPDPEHHVFASIQARIGAALKRILGASGDVHPRIMLSVIGYVDIVTVAAAIKTATSWPMPTKLGATVACVSALNAYVPDAHGAQAPLPKLLDQLSAGFATHVVITHSAEVAPGQLGRLRYHIDQANPFADIQVLATDVFPGPITSLLSIDRFESAYYKSYRDAQFPGWDRKDHWEDHVAAERNPAIPESLRFEIAPGIDKTRFLQSLGRDLTPFAKMTKSMDKIHPFDHNMAKSPAVAPGTKGIRLAQSFATEKVVQGQHPDRIAMNREEYGECWCVEARVTFAGESSVVHEYVSTGSYARLHAVPKGNSEEPSGELEIKITGHGLNPNKLHELILGCYTKLDGAVQPLRTKMTISLEEKRELQKQHMMDPLPEGFYYDGTSYIDQFGTRYEFHPDMNKFIEEHVRTLNELTEKNNAKVAENRRSQDS